MKIGELKEKLKQVKYKDGEGKVGLKYHIWVDNEKHADIHDGSMIIETITYDYQNTVWLSNWGYHPCANHFESITQLIDLLDKYQDDFEIAFGVLGIRIGHVIDYFPIIDYSVILVERELDDYGYPRIPEYNIHVCTQIHKDKYDKLNKGIRPILHKINVDNYYYYYVVRATAIKAEGCRYLYLNEDMLTFRDPLNASLFYSTDDAEKWFNDNFGEFKRKELDKQLDINTLEIIGINLDSWVEKRLEVPKIEEETE